MSLRSAGVANPRIGRDLGPLLAAHGAREVRVDTLELALRDYAVANVVYRLEETAAHAAATGAVSQDIASAWVAALRSAANDGRFVARVTLYVARGGKT